MKIGIDVTKMHEFSKMRGIGRYTQNLFEALKKYTDVEVKLIDKKTDENFDVIHYPFFDLFQHTLPINKKFPTLVTIHDVTPLVFPKQYPPGIKGKLKFKFQRLALKNVRAIMTDSDASKKDIVNYLSIPSKKIFPVHSAPAEYFKPIKDRKNLDRIQQKFNLPDRFALYTGGVNYNKNLLTQAEACIKADLDLVLVGGGFKQYKDLNHPELKSYKLFIEKYAQHPKVHILGFVEDNDLVCLMNLSSLLMLVSYYEGFGLPILEAQSCEIPVLTSDTSSMPEVAGEGALLVNPNSVEEITDGIKKIINDERLRAELIKKGIKNSGRFSFKKMAEEALNVYKYCLQK